MQSTDEKLQQITGQIFIGQGILVAYELGLFKLLSMGALSIQDIARKLQLKIRAAQSIISCATSLDLIESNKNLYQLSKTGEIFLNPSSQAYYGNVLDLLIQENHIMNYTTIKNCILHNCPQVSDEKILFETEDNIANTEKFIDALHYKAIQPAFYWPNILPLGTFTKFIDIGGASGIHTISACLKNHNLSGIVCDRPEVVP